MLYLRAADADRQVSCGITPPPRDFKVFPSKKKKKNKKLEDER